jgi:hypothetical protein
MNPSSYTHGRTAFASYTSLPSPKPFSSTIDGTRLTPEKFSDAISFPTMTPSFPIDIMLSPKRGAGSTKPATRIPGVNPKDVLCGRDKISHAHVGNKHFRKIIESYREEYQNAGTRDKKTQITSKIIASVQAQGGRFLKLGDVTDIWEEVTEQYAREKVSHALRSAKDPHRPRVKKPRQTKEYIPTDDENAFFEDALAEQQRIFKSLVDGHVGSQGDDTDESDHVDDNHEVDDDCSTSWNFYDG